MAAIKPLCRREQVEEQNDRQDTGTLLTVKFLQIEA